MPGYGYSDRPTRPPLDSVASPPSGRELMACSGTSDSARRAGTSAATSAGTSRSTTPTGWSPSTAWTPASPSSPATRPELAAEERLLDESRPGLRPRVPTVPSTARSPRPPPSGSPIPRPGSPRGSSRSFGPGATAAATSSGATRKDEILTNVTLYWLTGSIGSSMRMYARTPRSRRSSSPAGSRCRPGSRCSPATSCVRRGPGSSAPRTSCASPSRRAAGTSRRSRSRSSTPRELREFFRPYRQLSA